MGQSYKIINIDKREFFSPWDFDCGAKLMEFSYTLSDIVRFLEFLMSECWKGDTIIVCGNYADNTDVCAHNISKTIIDKPTPDIQLFLNKRVVEKLEYYQTHRNDFGATKEDILNNTNLFHLCKCFTNVSDLQSQMPENFEIKFYYNLSSMQYIDKSHLPLAWLCQYDNGEIKPNCISPLTLLLAQGNGKGGGDFFTEDRIALVGAWADTSNQIVVSAEKFADHSNFEEFKPDFYEGEFISYLDIESRIKELEQESA